MSERKFKRGAHRREDCVFIGAWVPKELLDLLDQQVINEDSDRSKMLRKALEEKIRSLEAAA